MKNQWHTFSLEEIFKIFGGSEHGLSDKEAAERLKTYGPNSLPEEKPPSKLRLFLSQFQSPLIYVLFAASLIVFAMGEMLDGSVILAVLLINSIVGVIQEGKAQNTLLALKKFVETDATVIRGGKEYIIPDREVVPGDIILLQEGDRIPADARVIVSNNLKIDEASLTGESEPVHKIAESIEGKDLPTPEQKNMVFRGTHISSGNGKAIVVATGVSTVIGEVASRISSVDTDIPLKVNIQNLSKIIIGVVSVVSAILFVSGILLGYPVKDMFTTVVSLSVSVIPEGLPIVITLVLATGVWRMSKRNALVKKLQAVEALGQASVIAVDKTGTITKNELVVRKIWTEGKFFEVSGLGYEPKGEIRSSEGELGDKDRGDILFLGRALGLSSSARLFYAEEEQAWKISGDPTEAAMLVLSEKMGFHKDDILIESPLVAEMPFDYKLKYHATLNKVDGENLLIVTGAPETLLSLSSQIRRGGENHHLSDEDKEEAEKTFLEMSRAGLRAIGVAIKHKASDHLDEKSVHALTFLGFLGMQDVLRPEVADAMSRSKQAGIKVVMITGDHKITARALAKEAGIYKDGDTILSGAEIDAFSEEELAERLADVSVFARVTPEHKMRIINAYKKRGEVIAMTGDGVNDAPSLVAADLGVSMGKIGTEVAKEASDIVLLDDNFGSIVSAVEEGRNIYKTVKKAVLYLFSTSVGEVAVIVFAIFLGFPLPLVASQIIWLNFVTDGFLTVALGMESKERGLLSGKFLRPNRYILDSLMVQRMILMAIPMTLGTLILFSIYFESDLTKAWTVSLTTLAVFQWFNAWNCRSEVKSIFQKSPFSNKSLIGATVAVIFLQIAAVYTPFMQKILRTSPLEASEWLLIIGIASSIILVEEARKFLYRLGRSGPDIQRWFSRVPLLKHLLWSGE